jgi:pyrimidine deaminase RibD-like protein
MSKATKDQSSKDNEILNLINGDDDEEEDEEDVILQLDGDGDNMMEFEELDVNNNENNNEELKEEEESEELKTDKALMRQAIQMASSGGGERGSHGPFPDPICGAVLVSKDGRILGKGRSTYAGHAIEFAFQEAGINATPLREWCVAWPSDAKFRKDISESTLYVTLEPSNERAGEEKPPITQLVEMAGIPRLVIGCQDPIAENASKGAGTLHAAGVSVTMGILQDECNHLIESYATLCNSKIQRMARQHSRIHGRPMGHLHCSVIDSDDAAAFARNGNSFGKNFGGQHLSYRDFGTYEIAPPPESIWAADTSADDNLDEFSSEVDDFFTMEFEDEDSQEGLSRNPMMPWYEQVDACVATFPKRKCFLFPSFFLCLVFRKCLFIHIPHYSMLIFAYILAGNGPVDDPTLQARLRGLTWLATHGKSLPAGVERILVMDATDLKDLPLTNDDPNLLPGVDIEEFWRADGRKPTRVLLRHGDK